MCVKTFPTLGKEEEMEQSFLQTEAVFLPMWNKHGHSVLQKIIWQQPVCWGHKLAPAHKRRRNDALDTAMALRWAQLHHLFQNGAL